jgi:hypothetical protein
MKLTASARSLQADMQAELLTNSCGDRHYPNQKLDAASLVYSKAAQIIWRSAGRVPRICRAFAPRRRLWCSICQ